MPQAETIRVSPESPVKLQVVATAMNRTLLPATTGDGSACFVQEGVEQYWLIVDAPGPSRVLFKVQVPWELYEAVAEAFGASETPV